MEGMYLIFAIEDREYGIEIKYLIEIVALHNITEIPDVPNFVKGVINLRGKVIPVIDIRLRFKFPSKDYHDRTCVVIVNIGSLVVGLIVDSVREVIKIPKESIEPAPRIGDSISSRFIQATGKIGDGVKILLNLEKLLYDKEAQELSNFNQILSGESNQ
ncbi:MAG: purine-binding chemotaxis protein CheW [Leptospiraceae bacterium]|nr:purine-binding chemotaxis protein CheW [Leptospiraceae bacterium]MCP5493979.1 purine-binding chemotaxis protein CheW [Leptospiraceae bacterium]